MVVTPSQLQPRPESIIRNPSFPGMLSMSDGFRPDICKALLLLQAAREGVCVAKSGLANRRGRGMTMLAIVQHLQPEPPPRLRQAVDRLADALRRERPELSLPERFHDLASNRLDDGPTLHVDDLSEISGFGGGQDVRFYQDRARLRAGDNDLVATCGDPVPGHKSYCRDYLGLGSPEWLRPRPPHLPLRIAEACWEDAKIRRRLIDKLRHDQLLYIHPNMGTFAVWKLGFLLHGETNRPIKMIAPPPGVTRWVNDKIAFAATVARLFGPELVPRTDSACNFATMAQHVRDLCEQSEMLGFKLPCSAGGDGNLVVNADQFRGRSLQDIRGLLKERLSVLDWDGYSPLLIDSWETDVLGSPSAQLWIPPQPQGPPIVEGIFMQTTEGVEGVFVGTAPAHFPAGLTQEITDLSWLLARLFQILGYVGRCSFDMIVVGNSLDNCRLEFIECNGRWGGTSLHMTLMNRIFGDWIQSPFAVHVAHHIPGLDRFEFVELLDRFGDELFDARTGKGSLILSNPGRLRYQSGITATVLASSWNDAARYARRIPERLRRIVQERSTVESPTTNEMTRE